MIGSIRKHSTWLWILIIIATIVSFIFWGAMPGTRGGGGPAGGLGMIYGKEVTPEAYAAAKRAFYITYWQQTGEWPNRNPNFKPTDLDRETYVRLLLTQKAKDLGIVVSDDAVKTAAVGFLQSLGRKGQPVPFQTFVERVLQPEGLTVADFERFLRTELTIEQLRGAMGLSGTLVTPQEASQLYDHDHQEVAAQAVFFSASNYLAQVKVTPAAVGQFYTNNMAAYREPDRVQVTYVAFEASNFLAQAKAEWAKTNFEDYVNAAYRQYGATEFADAKTPEEAKAKIREALIHQRALADAHEQANDFANTLFAMEPVKTGNLAAFAAQKGLAMHTTAPFSESFGPVDFSAPEAFTKAAFQLSADEPFGGPVVGPDAVYILALDKQLPSTIPALAQIHARVTEDFKQSVATELAQRAGTNFFVTATIHMATGKSFAQAAINAGCAPTVLSPFSLSSTDVPEAGDRADLRLLKQAAFTTPVGHLSSFVPTEDGGFVLFVQSLLPVDASKKISDLPQFTAQIRRARENEAFNLWLQTEASRELRNTPLAREMAEGGTPAK